MTDRRPVIIWGDPPNKERRSRAPVHKLTPELQELRDHPDTWGRIATRDSVKEADALAKSVRHSHGARAIGRFETKVRRVDGGYGLWAKYVGADGEAST